MLRNEPPGGCRGLPRLCPRAKGGRRQQPRDPTIAARRKRCLTETHHALRMPAGRAQAPQPERGGAHVCFRCSCPCGDAAVLRQAKLHACRGSQVCYSRARRGASLSCSGAAAMLAAPVSGLDRAAAEGGLTSLSRSTWGLSAGAGEEEGPDGCDGARCGGRAGSEGLMRLRVRASSCRAVAAPTRAACPCLPLPPFVPSPQPMQPSLAFSLRNVQLARAGCSCTRAHNPRTRNPAAGLPPLPPGVQGSAGPALPAPALPGPAQLWTRQ